MDSHERFAATMRHEAPDRVPMDLGATCLTAMRPGVQARLRDVLGFSGPPEPSNTGVDERILSWAGTDFRGVGGLVVMPSRHSRRISETAYVNCWGIGYERVGGEWQITRSPLSGATEEDLESYAWPEPRIEEGRLAAWEAEAKRLREDGRYVVIAEHPIFGVLELGLWLCGYERFLFALAGEPDFARAL
jgi:uroporphyrinogen decarboxylase